MPLNKREKKVLEDAINHLTMKHLMADKVADVIFGEADIYLRTWVVPLLVALRDGNKREIDQMARYL